MEYKLKTLDQILCVWVCTVQAALAIRRFAIRSFDYPQILFCAQNLVSAGFFLIIPVFFMHFGSRNKTFLP